MVPFLDPGARTPTPGGLGKTRRPIPRIGTGRGGQTICELCLGLPSWNLPELGIIPELSPGGGRLPLPPPTPAPRCEQWVNIGPANVTGVIRALAVHPTQPDTLYAGAHLGGVWRTIDGGKTWSPTMDRESNLVVYALGLCRANPNVLYAAMSSAPGFSLYRSADGGWSWSERRAPHDSFTPGSDCRASDSPVHGLHRVVFRAAQEHQWRLDLDRAAMRRRWPDPNQQRQRLRRQHRRCQVGS